MQNLEKMEGGFRYRKLKNALKKVTYKKIQECIKQIYCFKIYRAFITEIKHDFIYDIPEKIEELKRLRGHPISKIVETIKTSNHLRVIGVIK